VVAAELLGAVGAFRRGILAATCAALGVGAVVLARRLPARPAEPAAAEASSSGPWAQAAAMLAVALVLFEWGSHSVEVLGRGMADPDTLWYHMPFAARFAQSGWTTALQYTQSEPITTFHPAGVEL